MTSSAQPINQQPNFLATETVQFFIAATRFVENYLRFQIHSLYTDPFFTSSFPEETNFFEATALAADFSTVHHLACWLETAFITLDGNNKDNLSFMMHFTKALQEENRQDSPIMLKREKYEDIVFGMNVAMLRPICHFYLKHLQMQRNSIATSKKLTPDALKIIDAILARLSIVMASEKFASVAEDYAFSVFKM